MEEKNILRKHFMLWKQKTRIRKEKVESIKLKIQQNEKLDNLMKTLKKYKKEKQSQQHQEIPLQTKQNKKTMNLKNRFDAQKNTIEKLTLKLEEKDRIIEELKLGILDKDALKAVNETKVEIRKIFADCSVKVRCKVAPPLDYSKKFMISTQKAPKILQEMEGRALERARRREIIFERKRVIEENRRRLIAEALEKKHVQDEEEKRRNLETIKERRRKELELEKIRHERKLIFLEKLNRAVALYNFHLLKIGFKSFQMNYKKAKYDYVRSVAHYNVKITKNVFTIWLNFVDDKYKDKNALADAVFAKNVLTKVLQTWCEMRTHRIRSTQVAEDFHDLLLLNNTFVHWHRYICIQVMIREKQLKLAKQHYNRRILFHYFYQWRTLPAVMLLEKSKEQKKKKWRQKVWEVLPDYEPPTDYA